MSLIVGVLLIILGAVALCAWKGAVIIFLKGLVVFSLLFWGLMSLVVGYAGWKAKRQVKIAFAGGPSTAEESAPAPLNEETLPPTA